MVNHPNRSKKTRKPAAYYALSYHRVEPDPVGYGPHPLKLMQRTRHNSLRAAGRKCISMILTRGNLNRRMAGASGISVSVRYQSAHYYFVMSGDGEYVWSAEAAKAGYEGQKVSRFVDGLNWVYQNARSNLKTDIDKDI